ncbi:FAD/NAD(P)-binding protein [Paraburkholderia sp. 2C]
MKQDEKSVALVGGGAACVATFIALVKQRAAHTIYVIAPGGIGPGMVFGSRDADLLCNTSAEIMSVTADAPQDFLLYLRQNGQSVDPEAFVPRSWVGAYLADRFRRFSDIACRCGIKVIHLPYRFRSVRAIDGGGHELTLESGETSYSLFATDVVFCTGFGAPRIPDVLKAYIGHPRLIDSPYPEADMLGRIPRHARVLVVGSKLSAVDAAILLCRQNCKVSMVSPSGALPAVRGRSIRNARFRLDRAWLESLLRRWTPGGDASYPKGLRHAYLKFFAYHMSTLAGPSWRDQFSTAPVYGERLREQIRLAELGQCQWQDLLVDLVETINAIYAKTRSPFPGAMHPAIGERVEPYLTSLALPNAKKLHDLIEDGLLSVSKGRLLDVIAPPDRAAPWSVNWGEGFRNFDAIVITAGFHAPRLVRNEMGEMELEVHGARDRETVTLSQRLSAEPARPAEQGHLWFVGPPAHSRVPISSALFVNATVAERVAGNLVSGHRATMLDEYGTQDAAV